MGGHSAAAGHGNNLPQQYTMQVSIFYLEYCQRSAIIFRTCGLLIEYIF